MANPAMLCGNRRKRHCAFVGALIILVAFSLRDNNKKLSEEEVADDVSFCYPCADSVLDVLTDTTSEEGNGGGISGSTGGGVGSDQGLEDDNGGGFSGSADHGPLEYDFYRQSCPQAEAIVLSTMMRIYSQYTDSPPALLRLFFHDCFIKGCDASVFLDDSGGDLNHSIERQAIPNLTLKGFDKIDMIKEELEQACPGVVSCADTLALATRDGIVMSGGPFYPVFTGRRDSTKSYFQEAMADIPNPNERINRTLELFSSRGFDERETVSLLGGHNTGKISCDFILPRLSNFSETGEPDTTMSPDFLDQMRVQCQDPSSSTFHNNTSSLTVSGEERTSTAQGQSVSIPSGMQFDTHYYQNLLRRKGLLFADQQLMEDEITARIVRIYASDNGTTFRRAFVRAMVRMSNLGVLTGAEGQIRKTCSKPFGLF